jgi:aldehyde dehydrogenase (NAD+)
VGGSAFAIFHNQGQACIAGSRLIIHEDVKDQFLERFIGLARSIRLGDPMDTETEMGPLTSRIHHERVLKFIEVAKAEGGEILSGGVAPQGELKGGFFIEPTVVAAKPSDRVSREEVFGPFVTVTTFRDDAEALALANGVDYGLGAGLWTRDITRAHSFAKRLHAGMVWINCYKRVHPGSPFGGVGESGYGREMGFEAMREYTQPKSVWVNVDAEIPPFYRR